MAGQLYHGSMALSPIGFLQISKLLQWHARQRPLDMEGYIAHGEFAS